MFVQELLNGLIIGSVYALFSLGFTLVFGVQGILNLAHGGIFMAGAFVGLYAITLAGLPLPLAFLFAVIAGGMLGVVLDFVAFRPLRRRQASDFGAMVSSIGANLVLISIAQQISNAQVSAFPFGTFPIVIYRAFGLRISLQQIVIVLCFLLFAGALLLYLYKTSFGRQVRAVAVNERTATLLGINPAAIYFQTFFISGALAAAAGVIIGIAFNSVHFLMGEPVLLRALVVVVLGGLGSVVGSMVAGLALGVVQSLIVTYLSSQLSDAITFALLFLVLLISPGGLFKGLRADIRVARR